MPGSFSLRHAYLANDTEPRMMRNPVELYVIATSSSVPRDQECSGRSLATLLVAWVSAAMVASVLLRWKYMWIALAVLTLLFLIACGYAACASRRALQRQILTNEAYMEHRRRDIQSVSGNLSCTERTDPPAYQTYWITDLPPPYAVVIATEAPPPEERVQSSGPRVSDPPPYSVAVQDHATCPDQSSTISHVTGDVLSDDKASPAPRHAPSGTYFSNFLTRFGRSRSRNSEPSCREGSNVNETSGSSRPDVV